MTITSNTAGVLSIPDLGITLPRKGASTQVPDDRALHSADLRRMVRKGFLLVATGNPSPKPTSVAATQVTVDLSPLETLLKDLLEEVKAMRGELSGLEVRESHNTVKVPYIRQGKEPLDLGVHSGLAHALAEEVDASHIKVEEASGGALDLSAITSLKNLNGDDDHDRS